VTLRDPPARPRSIERTADELQLMPPDFCGVWCERRAEWARRDTRRRSATLLRLALRSRPEGLAELQATEALIERLRRLELAWR
jgi:hypothetical protein